MDFLPENNVYVYSISIVLTICALVASTRYTMKNILKIWGGENAKKTKVDADDARESEDGDGGSEGDDEAEDEISQADRIKLSEIDPVEYCEHIQGEVKKVQQKVATKKIQESMSAEQLEEEKNIQQKQLEQIFALMKEQEEKFGVNNVTDIHEQMRLYA